MHECVIWAKRLFCQCDENKNFRLIALMFGFQGSL